MAQQQLLLIEDVEDLGNSGDIVMVKPGYARNYLIPQQKALIATKQTLKKQTKLKEERAKKALLERKESEELAVKLLGKEFSIVVKVDPEGHMYGSVNAAEIAEVLKQQGFNLDKKNILLARPIKTLGSTEVQLKLKEGVQTQIKLTLLSESGLDKTT